MTKFFTEPLHPAPHDDRTVPSLGGDGGPDVTAPWNHAPAALPRWTGHVLSEKFAVAERLGVGGMGEVYRANHLSLGVPVAVKIMHAHVAAIPEYIRRFRREAYAASRLRHRNVVRVIDFGEDDGVLYIAMEMLVGRSLSAHLQAQSEPPPFSEVAELFDQVLDAFDAAHAAGIVHRDLKTENVFLTIEADGKRVVKVVDFGLAHVEGFRDQGPTLTKGDMVSGTPEYMSPEQCRSLAVGPSTDIYALGCLLTELLQLAPPFRGSAIEVMTQQMFVPPPPLARPAEAPPVPPLLERLRLSLLAKTPEQRPATVKEVRRLFHEALDAAASEAKLPPRAAAPAGRPERAPAVAAEAASAAPPVTVRVVRLTDREDGVGQSCITGLAAQGIATSSAPSPDAGPGRVVLLDAGNEVDLAAAWLRQRGDPAPVVVCLADVTTARMNALIAAGARDIVPYPPTSDVVARKVRRAAKHRG